MNLNTIASNIATRFSAANITPPTGLTNVTLATHLLPNAIADTPTVLVKPPLGDFEYGPGNRTGELTFPVEFYVSDGADKAAASQKLYSWYGVLLEQLTSDYDIGGPPEVIDATIIESRAGTLTYAEQDFVGIVFAVRVRVTGAYNATT